jgi:hypothetical protein
LPSFADKKPSQPVKPMAGPRAVALRVTWLYISPDKASQKVDRVQIGREMVVAERSGAWLRVYANTDIEQLHEGPDTPLINSDEAAAPPISGWLEAKGIVDEKIPNGDQILMGAAAGQEALASDPRGPVNAAESARLLYHRLAEMFPDSPLVAEARWRAADIHWQIEKNDKASLPSSRERDAYLREQLDESDLKKVIKYYPRTRWAALAAFDLLDNKLCGDAARKKSRGSTSNTPTNTRTGRAPRALFMRQSTGWPCSRICMRPTATDTKAATPATRRVLLPRN